MLWRKIRGERQSTKFLKKNFYAEKKAVLSIYCRVALLALRLGTPRGKRLIHPAQYSQCCCYSYLHQSINSPPLRDGVINRPNTAQNRREPETSPSWNSLVHGEFFWILNLLFPLQSRDEPGNLENSAQEPVRGRQWQLTCWGTLEKKTHSMCIIQPQFPTCRSREGRTQAYKSTPNATWILESLFHNLSDPILTCKKRLCGETGRAAAALVSSTCGFTPSESLRAAQQSE